MVPRSPTLVLLTVWLASAGPLPAQGVHPSVTLMPPQGHTRVIDFTTDEGTDMSVSVAPDGRWLAFDLLGHVYRLPMEGGEAVALTQNSGGALNFHPAISPDGRRIAFISDRQGQNNVWIMGADGSDPRLIFRDLDSRFTEPVWTPDGKSLVAVRAFATPGRGWHRQTKELWQLFLDGHAPVRLLGGRLTHYESPRFSADGTVLYYHVSYSTGDGLGLLTAGHRLQRLILATGKTENVRTNEPTELSPAFLVALRNTAYAADVDIDPPAALAPVPSPDGRSLAFAFEEVDRTFEYRGHTFGPRTALFVRDLATGTERRVLAPITKEVTQLNAQYQYRVIPTFSWTPDGRAIVLAQDGKLTRVEVATGEAKTIPFTARVHRIVSEQPRSRPTIDDSVLDVKFIQWPAGSPDGRHLAFVAVGRVWLMDLPNGTPRPLTNGPVDGVELTPAWSPDGRELAYATWNERERGRLWRVAVAGQNAGAPVRMTDEPGEYLYPMWSRDGRSVIVSKGSGPTPDIGNGWRAIIGWTAVRIPVGGGAAVKVADLGSMQAVSEGYDGRLRFPFQPDPLLAASGLYYPFPPPEVLAQQVRVRSVARDGSDPRDLYRIPAERPDTREHPVLSPDGKWLAFEADRSIYVRPVSSSSAADSGRFIDTDPNHSDPKRIQVGRWGGLYQSWRDGHTLQFASGHRYLTYDLSTRRLTVVPIRLRVPRLRSSGTVALTNAKIITIDSNRVIERGTVLVRGSRIACVGVCDASTADKVYDLSGKVIVPGFVDLHSHHTTEPNGIVVPPRNESRLILAYGVTTTIDPATNSESAFPLAEMVEAGVIAGPRTFSSAEFVISPGAAWGMHRKILTRADADFEVNRRADWGAITIKNFRQARREQHQYIISAARARGITVTSEGGPLFFDVGLAIDGQTGWEHLLGSIPIYKDASTFFGRAGIVYSPTVIVAGHVNGSKDYFRFRQHLLDDPKYNRFVSRTDLERQYRNARELPKSEFSFPLVAEGLADIVRAGGHGAVGEHGEQTGIGTHWEIWAYAEALSPLEALKVATLDGAYFVGLDRELGSITTGKLADLIVLNADPLVDIHNTAAIKYVMKHGVLYDGETLARER